MYENIEGSQLAAAQVLVVPVGHGEPRQGSAREGLAQGFVGGIVGHRGRYAVLGCGGLASESVVSNLSKNLQKVCFRSCLEPGNRWRQFVRV